MLFLVVLLGSSCVGDAAQVATPPSEVIVLPSTPSTGGSQATVTPAPSPTAASPLINAETIPANIDTLLYNDDKQPVLRVIGYVAEPVPGGLQVSIAFEPQAQLTENYRIWMHGLVSDTTILPPDRQQYGFDNFDHTFATPTSSWEVGKPYVHTHTITANPGEYTLRFGLWVNDATRLRTEDGGGAIVVGKHEVPRTSGSQATVTPAPSPTAASPLINAETIPANIDTLLYNDDKQPVLRVIGYVAEPVPGGLQVSIAFEPQAQLTENYRIWMHGLVSDTTILPPDRQQYGFDNFDHTFATPTSSWEVGKPYVHTHTITANPGEYTLRFGLWVNDATRLRTEDGGGAIVVGKHEVPPAK